jgi:hypothetical protein
MTKPSKALLALMALGQLTCNQAILTAPSGSVITLFANPAIIPSNGGVSVISALVIEPAGTVVADGTVVQFFTTLGTIDEQGKTNDGVARVNLRSTGRSGVAAVTAFSGGQAAPAPTPSASPGGGGDADPISGSATVTIGNLAATSINVTANPSRITVSRSTQITATVFDADGNPLPGVPVYFDVVDTEGEGGNASASNFMDSGGKPQFTDSNGQAYDVMRTRNQVSGSATVRAQVPAGGEAALISGIVVVDIVI